MLNMKSEIFLMLELLDNHQFSVVDVSTIQTIAIIRKCSLFEVPNATFFDTGLEARIQVHSNDAELEGHF